MDVSLKKSEDSHFLRVLGTLRKRPGMFIHPVTLESVRNFMSGYNAVALFKDVEGDYFTRTSPTFYDWIAMKESSKLSPALGWVEAIGNHSSSEDEAFKRFFQYLDEFIEREGCILFTYVPTDKDIENCRERFESEVEVPVKLQVVSYDQSVNGVFIRYLDDKDMQVGIEIHQKCLDDVYDYLGNTYMLDLRGQVNVKF